MKIVVLISGSGSNLQSIIDECENSSIPGAVVAVISNIESAFGLIRAKSKGIPAHALSHKNFTSREHFDEKLAELIQSYSPDLIVLAGFMRILTESFVQKFEGKMLNIHPSLLPKYPGLNTHKRALENRDEFHGASIHFVTAELDGGPVVLQSVLKVAKNDTVESLSEKVAKKEWLIYPLVIKWFCERRLSYKDGNVWFDNKIIKGQGFIYEDIALE